MIAGLVNATRGSGTTTSTVPMPSVADAGSSHSSMREPPTPTSKASVFGVAVSDHASPKPRHKCTLPKLAIPRDFVRVYLSIKGRKQLEHLKCEECGIDELLTLGEPWNPEAIEMALHPIRFLYEHASKGHRVGLSVCFYWFWDTNDGTKWYGEKNYCWEWLPDLAERIRTRDAELREVMYYPTCGGFVLVSTWEDRDVS